MSIIILKLWLDLALVHSTLRIPTLILPRFMDGHIPSKSITFYLIKDWMSSIYMKYLFQISSDTRCGCSLQLWCCFGQEILYSVCSHCLWQIISQTDLLSRTWVLWPISCWWLCSSSSTTSSSSVLSSPWTILMLFVQNSSNFIYQLIIWCQIFSLPI